jgi:hypothetical protein
MKSNVSAYLLIALGLLFLVHNLGWFDINIGRLIATWWPLILVIVGIGMLRRHDKTK